MKKMIFYLLLCLAWLVSFLTAADLRPPPAAQEALAPESANEARLNRIQSPPLLLDALGVAPGMAVAEIGAGSGRIAVHLALRVGPAGKVYAEDIDDEALEHLRGRCRRWGLANVEIVRGAVTDPLLPAGELDRIVIVSSYHHFADARELLRRARTALKPGGLVGIGEWLPEVAGDRESVAPGALAAQMQEVGYIFERTVTFPSSSHFYFSIFRVAAEAR